MPALPHLRPYQRIYALVWLRRVSALLVLPICVWGLARHQWWPALVLPMGAMLWTALRAWEQSLRRQFIRDAEFPRFLAAKVLEAHPGLQPRDAELVLRGLRQFFMAYLRSGRQFVGMPSKVVDSAWHAYILHTQGYALWCERAFGHMLHHTPAEAMGSNARRNNGLRRTWYWACKEESINPRKPARLPLLFALDSKFGIEGGYRYTPDCHAVGAQSDAGGYCGTDFGGNSSDGGGCGGGDFGGSDSSSDSSSSSSDGGSSDGGGCGGGCGGGGD
jgi:hypothetical protein